jgi:clan AA aspartic protease (TIGR02281 family)
MCCTKDQKGVRPGRGNNSPDCCGSGECDEGPKLCLEVRLKADARGHFVLDAAINDRPTTITADTGATLVVLTYEDAARLGLSPHSLNFSGLAEIPNGVARMAPITLDRVRVQDLTVRDVPAVVAERGALATNLLGMRTSKCRKAS